MAFHTALDVSLRSVSICIVDDDGAIQFEGKAASEVSDIVGCLKRFDPSIDSVGFEAGAQTGGHAAQDVVGWQRFPMRFYRSHAMNDVDTICRT